jgi:membrane protease subunit HflK
MMKLLSVERAPAANELRKRLQDRADELKLGIRVLLVGLQDIHPPFGKGRTEVAKKYEEVVGARQQVEARLREAEAYAATNSAFSAAEAERRIHEAEAYKVRKMASAAASAAQFTNQMLAFNASPKVFMDRNYLQAFASSSTNARKYILTTTNNPDDMIQFNLEDKYDPLFDERIRAATKK